ncbi:hypothetical protein QP028_07360 [Corynebacterium suedekumii]|nr:hypothetical protein QP028_07360 [Corynebacterium suedekumii]
MEKIADELLTVSENLPFVAATSETLEALLDSEWWEGVTIPDLEKVRREIRDLVEFVPRHKRQVVVLDVEDEFGNIAEVDLPIEHASVGVNVSRVEEELRTALAGYQDSLAMQKLRTARTLTETDVEALEAMVGEAGLEGVDEVRESLGGDTIPAFVRRLVGLDEEAMRAEFADLLEVLNIDRKPDQLHPPCHQGACKERWSDYAGSVRRVVLPTRLGRRSVPGKPGSGDGPPESAGTDKFNGQCGVNR